MPMHYKHLSLSEQDINFFIKRPKLADYFEKCVKTMNEISHEDFLKLSIYSLISTAKKLEKKEIEYIGHDMKRPTMSDYVLGFLLKFLKEEGMEIQEFVEKCKNITIQEFVEISKCDVNFLKGTMGILYLRKD